MVEYSHKIEKNMKAMQSEIKKSIQGTNSDGKETRTQINGVDQKEERNIQSEKNEEIRIQKNEESPGWCSSVDWAWTFEPKGPWFDS